MMRKRATRPFAAAVSLLLMAVVPAQAGPVRFAEVVQVIGGLQNGSQNQELRLRALQQQTGSTPVASGTTAQQQTSGDTRARTTTTSSNTDAATTTPTDTTTTAQPSLLNTAQENPQQQQGNVEVIDEGDVAGTVCDCGEITVPGGGFPKWPLIPLVGLICLTGICTPDHCVGPNCNQCVGPNCNPTVPEPTTLLMLSSGLAALGAGARRRYARVKLEKQIANATEV